MSWFILTLASVLVLSVASLLQRVLMKGDNSNPYSYGLAFHFLVGLLNLFIALWYGSDFSLLNGNIFILLLACALWATCTVFSFKALQLIEASQMTIISSFRILVTIAASIFFLHETFSGQNMLGAAIVIAAIALIVDFRKGFVLNKGVLYTLGMALFGGLAFVVDSTNVQHYDVLTYSAVSNLIIGLMILSFSPKTLMEWKQFTKFDFLKKMLPLIVCSTAQGILYLTALSYGGNTAQIGTIRQSSVIVIVILAVLFLHEREKLGRKFLAAAMVTLGVLLLS